MPQASVSQSACTLPSCCDFFDTVTFYIGYTMVQMSGIYDAAGLNYDRELDADFYAHRRLLGSDIRHVINFAERAVIAAAQLAVRLAESAVVTAAREALQLLVPTAITLGAIAVDPLATGAVFATKALFGTFNERMHNAVQHVLDWCLDGCEHRDKELDKILNGLARATQLHPYMKLKVLGEKLTYRQSLVIEARFKRMHDVHVDSLQKCVQHLALPANSALLKDLSHLEALKRYLDFAFAHLHRIQNPGRNASATTILDLYEQVVNEAVILRDHIVTAAPTLLQVQLSNRYILRTIQAIQSLLFSHLGYAVMALALTQLADIAQHPGDWTLLHLLAYPGDQYTNFRLMNDIFLEIGSVGTHYRSRFLGMEGYATPRQWWLQVSPYVVQAGRVSAFSTVKIIEYVVKDVLNIVRLCGYNITDDMQLALVQMFKFYLFAITTKGFAALLYIAPVIRRNIALLLQFALKRWSSHAQPTGEQDVRVRTLHAQLKALYDAA